MSTATLVSPAIAAFAATVRASFSDLTPEEVDDLTDGLEADLTERLDDSDAADLGDPVAYAEELRTAAGLPVREHTARSSVRGELRALRLRMSGATAAIVARYPVVAEAGRFFASIRPLWWVLRALLVTSLLVAVFNTTEYGRYSIAPISGQAVVIFLVAAVVSIQFGRGRWLPFSWMRRVLLIANVLLAVAAPIAVVSWASQINIAADSTSYADGTSDLSGTGLLSNGDEVSNIFAYDAQGKPLTDVQLFDQNGAPLDLVGDATQAYQESADGVVVVPNQSVAGRLGWNVYPLAHLESGAVGPEDTIDSSTPLLPAVAPFALAKALAPTDAVPSTAPSAPLTGGSSPSPAPTPTPTGLGG